MMADAILRLDASLFLFINERHTPALDVAFLFITTLGNGWVAALVVLLSLARKVPARRLALLAVPIAAALCAAWLTNAVLKRAIDRPRPLAHFSNARFGRDVRLPDGAVPPSLPSIHAIGGPYEDHSFPSGHASAACAAAVVLVTLWGRTYAWAFLLTGLVIYSRIYLGVHFPSDVAAGAPLGGGVTLMVLELTGVRRLVRDG
jgi:undecaprenyl-diphosphatase